MGLLEFGSALGQIGGQNNFGSLGQASTGQQQSQGLGLRISNCIIADHIFTGFAATGALRDGTGKEVKHPKSFIEELQAETDDWLKGAI